MRLRALVCRQCGAPLDVSVDEDVVCCDFCGFQFRPAMRIGPPEERLMTAAQVAAPTLDERKVLIELDDLDREWESHRGGFRPRKADGCYDVPTPRHCLAGALTAAIVGLSIGGGLLWIGVADEVAVVVILSTVLLTTGLLYLARLGCVHQRSLANYRVARRDLLERLSVVGDRVYEERRA